MGVLLLDLTGAFAVFGRLGVVRLEALLEVPNTFAHALPELWQLRGTEDNDDDQKDDEKLLKSWHCLVLSRFIQVGNNQSDYREETFSLAELLRSPCSLCHSTGK
jgi:hypothetical protein